MPRIWLYYFALVLLIAIRIVIIDSGFVDFLWYEHHEQAYQWLATLKANPQFLQFIGGWPLPVFILTVFCWWHIEEGDDGIAAQFLMLPLAYVPFAIIGDILVTAHFEPSNLYIYPLIIIPVGFIYVFIWTLLIWMLEKLRLVA